MKIHLEELAHQREALDAILESFPSLDNDIDNNVFANLQLKNARDEKKFIDIKMETGTGKTYVYTRMMFELNQKLGLNKFIIVVPSLAIKEGTKNFIESDYAYQHFSKFFPNRRIELQVIGGGDFANKKGKRKNFPSSLLQFCESSRNEKNIIQCILINTHMLTSKGFSDDSFDQTIFGGSSCPLDALKATSPIIIIDEPHRVKRDSSAYGVIKKIEPQIIVRFGATFPEIRIGKGKNASVVKDYYRSTPQFDLGAVESFNKDLVKGVDIQFPDLPENAVKKYKVKELNTKELVLGDGKQTWSVKINEPLSMFDGGLYYEGSKRLSNDLELAVGMELVDGVFTNSYQELLISQAIDAHFDTEISNFHRDGYRVKTSALFFIDSVDSYRDENGWLKRKFEELLAHKLDSLLEKYTTGEYHDFLIATKNNLSLSHGGYFAKDWGEVDDCAIAEEREDILHKERTLSFKKQDGSWNIRRFFFSKWTLREGWDNPNVFTICKLRTSGSESSKIQEVGRGLRLPVDDQGNRLSCQEWRLNFIIGWDEKDFAKKLVGEINSDAKVMLNEDRLTADMIKVVCEMRQISEEYLLEQLDEAGIIKRNNEFRDGGYDKFISLYPELLQTHVKNGKITSPSEKIKKTIKLRKDNWKKIKDVWVDLAKRYMLYLDRLGDSEIKKLFENVLNTDGVFDDNKDIILNIQKTQKSEDGNISLTSESITIENPNLIGSLKYNDFIEKLARRTNIPIQILHASIWNKLNKLYISGLKKEEINAKLNQNSLEKIVNIWTEKFMDTFAVKYNYHSLDFSAETSVLKGGSFVDELESGLIGINLATTIADDKRNLYEHPIAYDSEIEREVESIVPNPKITVFGKIPRRAIKVPTYTGGSTTPDFIYSVVNENNTKLTLLVETKARDMRGAEKRTIEAQRKLFGNIKGIKWKLATSANDVRDALDGI